MLNFITNLLSLLPSLITALKPLGNVLQTLSASFHTIADVAAQIEEILKATK